MHTPIKNLLFCLLLAAAASCGAETSTETENQTDSDRFDPAAAYLELQEVESAIEKSKARSEESERRSQILIDTIPMAKGEQKEELLELLEQNKEVNSKEKRLLRSIETRKDNILKSFGG